MSRRLVRRTRWIPLLLTVGVMACKDDATAPPTPSAVTVVSGSTITGTVGENVPTLVVRVTDTQSRPLSGTTVTFNVVDGGGTVTPTTATTNASGEASAVWTLGPTAGAQRAQAQVTGVSTVATFTATARAAAPASVAIQAGNSQSAPVGALVPVAPSVVVKDRFQNPVDGASVVFSVIGGGGSIGTPGATTNASGIATVDSWRLGSAVGTNTLSALVVSPGVTGNPVVFTASATAGPAASLTAQSSTSLTGVVGTAVTPLPSVRLVDASGNPIVGAQVNFVASAGSTVSGGAKLTNANGIATVDSWLLGPTAQGYTVTASSGTLPPVVFTAMARAGAAASVSIFAGNNQSVTVGRVVPIDPAVRVVDAFGNAVMGVEVVFDVTSGGGSAVVRRPLTNANGVAEVGGWTLGNAPGTNTLRATVTATGVTNNPVTFTATALAGAPASIAATAGNNQSALAGAAVAVAPSVIVRDDRGNPVSGAAVQFIVTSGGGTVTPATVTTNASGSATVSSWTLGAAVGQQTLVARIAGLPDVVFTATALAGAPASVQLVTASDLGTVVVNQFVSPSPAVRVLDASGNPVAGVQVVFQLDAGSGALITGATQNTGTDGIATLGGWLAGTLSGVTSRVRAFVTGLNLPAGTEPQFTATTVAGVATGMAVAPGSAQSQAATASAAVTTVPAVRITDAFGNAVVNALVQFTATAGNGTVTNAVVATDLNGVASSGGWTMPAGSGVRTLTATAVANNALTVTFTANVP